MCAPRPPLLRDMRNRQERARATAEEGAREKKKGGSNAMARAGSMGRIAYPTAPGSPSPSPPRLAQARTGLACPSGLWRAGICTLRASGQRTSAPSTQRNAARLVFFQPRARGQHSAEDAAPLGTKEA